MAGGSIGLHEVGHPRSKDVGPFAKNHVLVLPVVCNPISKSGPSKAE